MSRLNQPIACCGIDCSCCDIFNASNSPEIANRICEWFKNERGQIIKAQDIVCEGCRGDRAKHWSPDCWILKCCSDDKGHNYCHECRDFPCKRLADWAAGEPGYSKALERLKELKIQSQTLH